MKLDPTKMQDWQIAEAAEEKMKPVSQLADELGLKDDEGNSLELPALFVTQVLGAAMGIDPEPLGFELNRVSLDPINDIFGL